MEACRATADKPAKSLSSDRRADCDSGNTGCAPCCCCSGVMCSKVSIRFRIWAFFSGGWLLNLRRRSSRMILLLRRKAAESRDRSAVSAPARRAAGPCTSGANRRDVDPGPSDGTCSYYPESCELGGAILPGRRCALARRRRRRRCASMMLPRKQSKRRHRTEHQQQGQRDEVGQTHDFPVTPLRIVHQERRNLQTGRRSCRDTADHLLRFPAYSRAPRCRLSSPPYCCRG